MTRAVEIDEEEIRRLHAMDQIVKAMNKHPEGKVLLQKAEKLVNPNAPTPDLDLEQRIQEPVSELRKELNALKKEREERDAKDEQDRKLAGIQSQISTGLSKLRQDGWTDEGVKGVEKLMEEKGILDVDIAAAYFEKQHPPQMPATPSGSGSWNFLDMPSDGNEDLKRLIETKGESNQLLDKMSREALNEVRGQSRR